MRSLPTRQAVIGVATCDKGLPAMLMALAACHDLAVVAIPGGVTLPPTDGVDAGAVADDRRALRVRDRCRSRRRLPSAAARARRRAAAVNSSGPPRRRRSSPKRSGSPCRTRRSRRRGSRSGPTSRGGRRAPRSTMCEPAASTTRDILTDAAIRNAMIVHAAVGGSTNLLLHIPAIAHAAGLRRPARRRLARGQSPGAAARRRAAERPASHGSRLSSPAASPK